MNSNMKEIMENSKHYPTHPGAEHPPTMTCEIPLEEYESIKKENERLKKKMDDYHLMSDIRRAKIKELKHALWLARALSADHAANFCYYIAHYGKLNKVKKIYQDQDKWDKIEEICIKKVEEYK